MKKLLSLLFLTIILCSCTQGSPQDAERQPEVQPTWQEQYDLGVRFLSENNYAEAIIAFSAAIEIDPKQEDAYIGLADAYISSGDIESAISTLEKGLEAVDEAEKLQSKITEIQMSSESVSAPDNARKPIDGYPTTGRHDNDDGSYGIWEYDEYARITHTWFYRSDGPLWFEQIFEYHGTSRLRLSDTSYTYGDDNLTYYRQYDDLGRLITMTVIRDSSSGQHLREEHRYSYPSKSTAEIYIQVISDEVSLDATMTYSLHSSNAYVEVSGLSWSSTTSLKIRSVTEYDAGRYTLLYMTTFDESGIIIAESSGN